MKRLLTGALAVLAIIATSHAPPTHAAQINPESWCSDEIDIVTGGSYPYTYQVLESWTPEGVPYGHRTGDFNFYLSVASSDGERISNTGMNFVLPSGLKSEKEYKQLYQQLVAHGAALLRQTEYEDGSADVMLFITNPKRGKPCWQSETIHIEKVDLPTAFNF